MSQSDQSVEIVEPAAIDVLSISSDTALSCGTPEDNEGQQHMQQAANCRRTLHLYWTTSPTPELDGDLCASSGYAAFHNACKRQQMSAYIVDATVRRWWLQMRPRERLAFHAETFIGHMMCESSSATSGTGCWLSERSIRQYFRQMNNNPTPTS